jgi:protein-tyrosine phosphatase
VAPSRIEEFFFNLMVAGYVPILTHPERLTWINSHYGIMQRLAQAGVWMQITAGSLSGRFGPRPQYWAERMLEEGCVHVLATDAHDVERRPPNLSHGFELAAKRIGNDAAKDLVITRPRGVIENVPPTTLPMPQGASSRAAPADVDDRSRGPGGGRGLAGWLRR